VIDLGCGEGSLVQILLNDTSFHRIAGVDVNEDSLANASFDCQPTEHDHRFLREHPVECNLYQGERTGPDKVTLELTCQLQGGSVADVDDRLLGFDAISCVEVVEHLDPPVLAAFPAATLGGYRPRLMIVTTPNAEFNVNFPNLNYGTPEATLRNWDHRFEWTRKEFEDWANAAAVSHNYSVEFTGIGLITGSGSDLSHGHCTQVAIFTRNAPASSDPVLAAPSTPTLNPPYLHYSEIVMPYFSETGHTDADILAELKDSTRFLIHIEYDTASRADAPRPPVRLPFDRYWGVLRIRQLCRYREELDRVLRSPAAQADFEVLDGGDTVLVLFHV
ncbi:hypothetical protein BDK51DRAFT_12385, partial [Blyttiomyces helicus]